MQIDEMQIDIQTDYILSIDASTTVWDFSFLGNLLGRFRLSR